MKVELIPDRQMNLVVSHLPGVRATIKKEAEGAQARMLAVKRAHEAGGKSNVVVEMGKTDAYVIIEDTRSDYAAYAIDQEIGLFNAAYGVFPRGSISHERGPDGRFI